jgi:dTDP-4-dehydrorhamnose 3,5-epimerase
MNDIITIEGGIAKDERGQIRFVNGFDMTLIKRFYIIKNADTELIRGWRAHRIEQRWFYVLSGSFNLEVVKINDWTKPDPFSPVKSKVLKGTDMSIIHIPSGYATALRALENGSELLVYADYPITHAPLDDYIWEFDYFKNG